MRTKAIRVSALLSVLLIVSCAGAGGQGASRQRLDDYMRTHRDTAASVAEAIRLGHVVRGMDREQVTAALGKPIRIVRKSNQSGKEDWLYRMEALHQEELRGRGWSFVRITFLDGRVVALDPR